MFNGPCTISQSPHFDQTVKPYKLITGIYRFLSGFLPFLFKKGEDAIRELLGTRIAHERRALSRKLIG